VRVNINKISLSENYHQYDCDHDCGRVDIGAEPALKPHTGYGSHWFRHKDVFVDFKAIF